MTDRFEIDPTKTNIFKTINHPDGHGKTGQIRKGSLWQGRTITIGKEKLNRNSVIDFLNAQTTTQLKKCQFLGLGGAKDQEIKEAFGNYLLKKNVEFPLELEDVKSAVKKSAEKLEESDAMKGKKLNKIEEIFIEALKDDKSTLGHGTIGSDIWRYVKTQSINFDNEPVKGETNEQRLEKLLVTLIDLTITDDKNKENLLSLVEDLMSQVDSKEKKDVGVKIQQFFNEVNKKVNEFDNNEYKNFKRLLLTIGQHNGVTPCIPIQAIVSAGSLQLPHQQYLLAQAKLELPSLKDGIVVFGNSQKTHINIQKNDKGEINITHSLSKNVSRWQEEKQRVESSFTSILSITIPRDNPKDINVSLEYELSTPKEGNSNTTAAICLLLGDIVNNVKNKDEDSVKNKDIVGKVKNQEDINK